MALTFLTICREGVSSSWNITPLLITRSRIYSLGEMEIFYVKLKNLKRCIAIFNLVNNTSGGWNCKKLTRFIKRRCEHLLFFTCHECLCVPVLRKTQLSECFSCS